MSLNVDVTRLDPAITALFREPRETKIAIGTLQKVLDRPPGEALTELGSAASLATAQPLTIPRLVVGPRQWLDWILWALVGVAAYLLREIARHYRRIPEGEGDFLSETPWYRAQLFTDPLIAFVILVVLTQIDLSLLGSNGDPALSIDLGNFPPDALLVPAFVLGFYSRVARKVLDRIMRAFFRSAWLAAHGEFVINIKGRKTSDDVVEVNQAVVLETRPQTEVKWMASAGTIEASGAYTAPSEPQNVIVTGVAGAGIAIAKTLRVVQLKFTIKAVGDGPSEVPRGGTCELTLDPLPNEDQRESIYWRVADTKYAECLQDKSGAPVTVKAPKDADRIKIIATFGGYSSDITLKVVAGEVTEGITRVAATSDDHEVTAKAEVPVGKEIEFKAIHHLAAEEAQEITWTRSTEEDSIFKWNELPSGESATGVVGPSASGSEIVVTAVHKPTSSQASLRFKVPTHVS